MTSASRQRPIESQLTDEASSPDLSLSGWLEGLQLACAHYDLPISQDFVSAPVQMQDIDSQEIVLQKAQEGGLAAGFVKFRRKLLEAKRLPVLLGLKNGDVVFVESREPSGELNVVYDNSAGLRSHCRVSDLAPDVDTCLLVRPDSSQRPRDNMAYLDMPRKGLVARFLFADKSSILAIVLASLIANSMAMAGVLFSMQVYDRVIPAGSMNTLYVLFIGVGIAALFDFLMRIMRIRLSDILGKIVDFSLSDLIFGRAIRVRNDARPKSSGAFISQLRDIDQIREMITSTTLSVLADLPFFFLFLLVFWYIAGPLVIIPLVALLAIVLPGLIMQPRLARLSRTVMHDGAARNALIVEAIQGLDDIKSAQAEPHFHRKWNNCNEAAATANLQLRSVVNALGAWTHTVQTTVFAVVVLFGAPLVMQGDMTTGVLVAASILSSRMLAPMGSVSQLLSRWQHARAARESMDQIANLPIDSDNRDCVRKPIIHGSYEIRKATFKYEREAGKAALFIDSLDIKPGEKIAVLGRNGSGKSTLLQALAGLLEPQEGLVALDGVRLSNISSADVRHNIGWASQSASLFSGTIKENLSLGAQSFSDQQLIDALSFCGAMDFVNKLEKGLEHHVHEGGRGLSEGQKKAILLARTLVRDPGIILLDEPCACLDDVAERLLVENLSRLGRNKTVVITTHKLSTLDLADRVIVLNDGRIIVDEDKASAVDKIVRVRQMGASK